MTDDEFSDYWACLVEKVRQSTHATLSSDERIFYAANMLRGSVPRSGLIGYFENTECGVIRDAHHALVMLGLVDALKLLQSAQELVLKGRPLPDGDQFLALCDDGVPREEREKAMDDLDELVQPVQDQLYDQDHAIWNALCRFADERRLRAES